VAVVPSMLSAPGTFDRESRLALAAIMRLPSSVLPLPRWHGGCEAALW